MSNIYINFLCLISFLVSQPTTGGIQQQFVSNISVLFILLLGFVTIRDTKSMRPKRHLFWIYWYNLLFRSIKNWIIYNKKWIYDDFISVFMGDNSNINHSKNGDSIKYSTVCLNWDQNAKLNLRNKSLTMTFLFHAFSEIHKVYVSCVFVAYLWLAFSVNTIHHIANFTILAYMHC